MGRNGRAVQDQVILAPAAVSDFHSPFPAALQVVPERTLIAAGCPLMGKLNRCHHQTRSEEHTSELQSLMRTSYAVVCLKKKSQRRTDNTKKRTTLNIANPHRRQTQ